MKIEVILEILNDSRKQSYFGEFEFILLIVSIVLFINIDNQSRNKLNIECLILKK